MELLDIIKGGIVVFFHKKGINITRSSLVKILKKSNELEAYLCQPKWRIEIAISELMPPRSIITIRKEIFIIEAKMLEYSKKSRISSGAYKRDMANFSHKIRLREQEIERAKTPNTTKFFQYVEMAANGDTLAQSTKDAIDILQEYNIPTPSLEYSHLFLKKIKKS